jgi:hypothetical protein
MVGGDQRTVGVTAKMKASTDLCDPEGDGEPPRAFDIQSYEDLLQFPDIPESTIHTPSGKRAVTEPIVDAIVVPTIRSAEHLRPVVRFAAESRSHLIVVYTDKPPAGLSAVLDALRPGQFTLLTVRSDTKYHLLDLGASLPQSLVAPPVLDISRKRNLGLLIGRVCGWTRMLFLDDDIRKLHPARVCSAAALLDNYPVVALQVRKYPDASVVRHARRLAGAKQQLFVSGGSLLVNPQLINGYFAPVYHEDWLCVINHLRALEVAIGGSVGQLKYLPFAAPDRAAREEFGDILLSGLLWLVHAHRVDKAQPIAETEYWREATKLRFWKQILEQRAMLLQDLTARLTEHAEMSSPVPSLEAARQRLAELQPAEFVAFMDKWLITLAEWRDRLSTLSRVDMADKAQAIEKALAELGLAQVVGGDEAPGAGARRVAGFAARWGRRGEADGRRTFEMPKSFLTSCSSPQRVMAGARCSAASYLAAVRAAVCSAQRPLVTRASAMMAAPQPASRSQPA